MVRAQHAFGANPTEFRVEVNYVQGHNRQGAPVSIHGRSVRGRFDWTPVVRAVKVPTSAEKQFGYYPVLLTGKGTVCVDDAFGLRLGAEE
jgi:hypothetical protein